MKRLHLQIRGYVQGVGYRFFARDEARTLGLNGWVRNVPDGSVELVAEGRQEALEALIARCREGPSMSEVTDVRADWSDAIGEPQGFRIAH